MEDTVLDGLHDELAQLQAEEKRLSAERNRLQHQIDFGFATETSREREQKVSAERRRVHERIDAVRKLLRDRSLA